MKPILFGAAVASAFIAYFLLKRKTYIENNTLNIAMEPKPVQHHLTDAFAAAKRHINNF
ncbi:MAG: hypothetical protein ABIY62_10455 [Ginsengibacter sp.]